MNAKPSIRHECTRKRESVKQKRFEQLGEKDIESRLKCMFKVADKVRHGEDDCRCVALEAFHWADLCLKHFKARDLLSKEARKEQDYRPPGSEAH